jgi:hypothetical protein
VRHGLEIYIWNGESKLGGKFGKRGLDKVLAGASPKWESRENRANVGRNRIFFQPQ